MKIKLEFNGMLRQILKWKDKIEVEIPQGGSVSDALKKAGLDTVNNQKIGFATVNNNKVDMDHELNDGDIVKVFPRSFGG